MRTKIVEQQHISFAHEDKVTVKDKFLYYHKKKFYVKGVTYVHLSHNLMELNIPGLQL